ncbi:hypothetical protein GKR41_00704 [Candidatus Vallotia lariciata]|nr:hypothetical protein GKR41_00704 [Candidatus Vallotia lariciata]
MYRDPLLTIKILPGNCIGGIFDFLQRATPQLLTAALASVLAHIYYIIFVLIIKSMCFELISELLRSRKYFNLPINQLLSR